MPHRGRLPLTLLWTLVGLLLVLSIGGQIGMFIIQAAKDHADSMFGGDKSDRNLISDIVNVSHLVLPQVLRAGLLGGVALLFVHAVRWQRAHPATPSSRQAPSR